MKRSRTIVGVAAAVCALSLAAVAEDSAAPPKAETYGAALTLTEPTALSEVLRAPQAFGERPVLLHGRLSDVCQKKGCWTLLRDGTDHIRVRFQDYGFFLPTDSIGAEAFIQGTVKVDTLSEKEARHYESEARDGDPDSIRGPQREVGFVASGVRLVARAPAKPPAPGADAPR